MRRESGEADGYGLRSAQVGGENIVVRIPAICICSSKLKADATRVSRVFFPSFFFSSLPLFFLFPSSFPRLDENAFTVSSIGR